MPHTLQNEHWQAEILPELGASIGACRIRYRGAWVDVIRPTPPGGKPGGFLMLPWANRIREGRLYFRGESWQLATTSDDHTARHGDVRKRPWEVIGEHEAVAHYRFEAAADDDFNFPFALSARLTYALEDTHFIWRVTITNRDTRPFPAGFGFHPYFQRYSETMPQLQIPCNKQFILTDVMATEAAVPIDPKVDFREPRPVPDEMTLDHLLTSRISDHPIRLIYTDWQTEIQMHTDAIFKHVVVYTALDGTLAVEPQTNANDGFNLMAKQVPGHGVFVLEPGQAMMGEVRLQVKVIGR